MFAVTKTMCWSACGTDRAPALAAPQPDRVKNRSYSAQAIERFARRRSESAVSFSDDGKQSVLDALAEAFRKLRANFIKHGFDRVIYRDWDYE